MENRGTETDCYGNLIYVRVTLHTDRKRINYSLYIAGTTGYLNGKKWNLYLTPCTKINFRQIEGLVKVANTYVMHIIYLTLF